LHQIVKNGQGEMLVEAAGRKQFPRPIHSASDQGVGHPNFHGCLISKNPSVSDGLPDQQLDKGSRLEPLIASDLLKPLMNVRGKPERKHDGSGEQTCASPAERLSYI
jgi:hypothetical protein